MARRRNHGLRKRCGCPRAKWPKCSHGWHFNFGWKGVNHRLSLDRECGRHIETKTEAQTEAERLRLAIREGRPGKSHCPVNKAEKRNEMTLDAFMELFLKGYSRSPIPGRRRRGDNGAKASWRDDRAMSKAIGNFSSSGGRLGGTSVENVTELDVEAFLKHLHGKGRAASTRNHYLRIWKLMGRWAVKHGYRSQPFIGPDSDLRQEQWAQRSRRLSVDEERRLMKAANPNLQRLIIAALETGARRGELLSLQWKDVNLPRRELRLRAEKTKNGEDRVLPITDRLSAVLEMAAQGPDGHPHGSHAYVFGNEVGEAVESVKTAWASACRKACLSDLHFHDLRHEAGSRWVEGGVPIHHAQALLGHSNVRQTSTYLNVGLDGLKGSMKKFERNRQVCTNLAQNPPVVSAEPVLGEDETPVSR